ncbi:MAG: xanthine dehydrogenase family protein molybdopterin-binding subunit, partial [Chloroflexota bacterium]|nr:xanthine dehydrogenase family protein molybdopterin-binding subunit [Chloroflexota bacterium]
MESTQETQMIGAALRRKEDPRLLMGEGVYTGDVDLKGMVHMAVLRSPYANALIRGIDVSLAQSHSEVLAVLTGEEIKERCQYQFLLFAVKEETLTRSRWPMAVEAAKYVGEPVAVVVANSDGAARDALELIDVDYERLPAVVDLESAVRDDSPLVHEELGTNVSVKTTGTAGDPDGSFRD